MRFWVRELNQPLADFWRTDPAHFWLLAEPDKSDTRLTDDDKEELLQLLYEARENG
jgi:hypothetical protein